jgi:hypothetical protein
MAPQRPKQRRLLWRLQGPTKVAVAALYEHPAGTELRVYLEPESADDLLHSQVDRFDVGTLEDKAATLRVVLLEKGWRELNMDAPPLH